jgi:hypothetical protein
MLETEGLKVPETMRAYFTDELCRHKHVSLDELAASFDDTPSGYHVT